MSFDPVTVHVFLHVVTPVCNIVAKFEEFDCSYDALLSIPKLKIRDLDRDECYVLIWQRQFIACCT